MIKNTSRSNLSVRYKEVIGMGILKEKLIQCIPDTLYLKIMFKKIMHQKLDLKNPKTYNQKIQWLKLHDRKPQYSNLVDKYEVKKVVKEKIGAEYIIPTLGVWEKFTDIDLKKMPNQFVLKCTHDSGSVIICSDKNSFNVEKARDKLNKSLRSNYFYAGREWPYKNIKPRILAEAYIVDEKSKKLDDYKFFCFNGVVDNVMVVRGRSDGNPQFYHFNRDWKLCRFNRLTRSLPEGYQEEKPVLLDEMIYIAEVLSQGMIHVRIDLYEANGKIYFGEYTLYNQSGWETGFDDYSDGYLGNLIHFE